ncbi:MAG TPA: putative glycoside hydrolase, partial [Gemmatimonadales bacterium]|nr:putative glycoside hydrolase [Gemmatimonadales bacterium]
ADVVLPMVYPSHYAPGLYGFARPIANPYEIVRVALTEAAERTKFVADSTGQPVGEIMGWLEAMSIRGAQYGAAEVREQIQAVYDAGLKSWALWNPGSKFGEFRDALRPADGGLSPVERRGWKAPTWTPPKERLSMVLRKRVAAARADSIRRDSVAKAQAAGTGTAAPADSARARGAAPKR